MSGVEGCERCKAAHALTVRTGLRWYCLEHEEGDE